MDVISNSELRSILDQKESLTLILSIFCSLEELDEETMEQIEVLNQILEAYEDIIECICTIEHFSNVYNRMTGQNRG